MASTLGIAAAAWGLVMALAPVLQIRRMIVRRSSADLSLGYFGVLLPGFVLWVGYGLSRGDWPLVIPNTIAFTVGAVTVVTGLMLRRRAGRWSEADGATVMPLATSPRTRAEDGTPADPRNWPEGR